MNAVTTTATQTDAGNASALVATRAANQSGASNENGQYLTFMLGKEVFAFGILAIKEIIEYDNLTAVPMMPPSVRGVINLRGAVVPVVDLSVRFGRPATETTKRTCIVIVEVTDGSDRRDIGLIVDAVNEVLDIAASDIEPPPAFGARIHSDFIQGMGKVAGRFVMLLNVNRVLLLDELDSLTELADSPAQVLEAA